MSKKKLYIKPEKYSGLSGIKGEDASLTVSVHYSNDSNLNDIKQVSALRS
jgi:hypothetical protein